MTTRSGPPRGVVLALLTLAYAMNFVDRQILVIAAPALKAALALTDAQLGLLYGTAFALFYALFGLALARLADGWNRVWLLALALAWWSGMTALSAAATGFVMLALLRTLVGIGEASAAPAAFSLVQDVFPRERRGTALSIHAGGIYIGIGASLAIGGGVLAAWDKLAVPPLGLQGWQATFLAAGLPGLLLAVLIALLLREPVRGAIDGMPRAPDREGLRRIASDLALFVPGLATRSLQRMGASRTTLISHLALLALCVAGAILLTVLSDGMIPMPLRGVLATLSGTLVDLTILRRTALAFGFQSASSWMFVVRVHALIGLTIDTAFVQWTAMAIGIHAAGGWIAAFRLRQPAAAAATVADPRFVLLALAGGVVSIASYGIAGFLFLYGKSEAGLTPADGVTLGLITAVAGIVGTTTSGLLADRLRRRHRNGRIMVAAGAVAVSTLFTAAELLQTQPLPFLACNFVATLSLTMWLGPTFAAAQEEVPPESRGAATGLQFLAINLVGLGLGPYLTGLLSDATGDLRTAMLLVLAAAPVAVCLFVAAMRVPVRQASA